MSDDKLNQTGLSRRSFLGTAAVSGAGIAGAGLLGLAGCSNKSEGGAASGTAGSSAAADHSAYVGPGELDQYMRLTRAANRAKCACWACPRCAS